MKLEVATIQKCDTCVTVRPVWAPMKIAEIICGMPANTIRAWAASGDVRAKKSDASEPRSRVVYRVDDLLEMVDGLSNVGVADDENRVTA